MFIMYLHTRIGFHIKINFPCYKERLASPYIPLYALSLYALYVGRKFVMKILYLVSCPCVVVFRRCVEFFGNSMDRIGHEHFLATVDFKLSYLVGPRTKFRDLALSVQNAS